MTHEEACSLLGFEVDKDWSFVEVKKEGLLLVLLWLKAMKFIVGENQNITEFG